MVEMVKLPEMAMIRKGEEMARGGVLELRCSGGGRWVTELFLIGWNRRVH